MIAVDGVDHELAPEDLLVGCAHWRATASSARAGTRSRSELALDEPLLREGQAREIVHAVQIARRNAGFAVEDRIALWLEGDETLLSVAREHESYIAAETLAVAVAYGEAPPAAADVHAETVAIDGLELRMSVARRPAA